MTLATAANRYLVCLCMPWAPSVSRLLSVSAGYVRWARRTRLPVIVRIVPASVVTLAGKEACMSERG